MTPEQYRLTAQLFEHAQTIAPSDRRAYLDEAATDAMVREKVESMLSQLDRDDADDPLAAPIGLDRARLETLRTAFVDDDAAPERIGDYEVTGRLGAGGMGVVYRATQARPRRDVALKVMRPGAVSRSALRRFSLEAELLGRLEHPGIARIYEAGTWDVGEGGRPYFAMELVDGPSLVAFAAAQALSTRERVALMIRVCEAVQHAHVRGVVHRDLKPANVLVGSDGEPKILDFGVARATDCDVQATTVETATGQLIGTIGYMSPEQVRGDARAVDLRSDVYALGATLFELLVGRMPHELADVALTEAVRIIGFDEPARLGTIDRSLRGDLDTIVAKSLERDSARRYQSAGELADDLRAWADHRPIRARPSGPGRWLAKWARRHPARAWLIAASIVLMVALAVGLRAQRRLDAQAALAEGVALVERYEAGWADAARDDETARDLLLQRTRYTEPGEDAVLEARQRELDARRRERPADFHRALNLLAQAERSGASADDVDRARARLYLTRHREAKARHDPLERELYARLARESDRTGEIVAALQPSAPATLATEPPGAAAYLFHLLDQSELVEGGEPRLVPVPHGGADGLPVPPGTWCLRVVNGAGALDPGDVIFEVAGQPVRDVVLAADDAGDVRRFDRLVAIAGRAVRSDYDVRRYGGAGELRPFEFERAGARLGVEAASVAGLGVEVVEPDALVRAGGVPVRVWRAGRVDDLVLPSGLDVRTTAIPLFCGPAAHVGTTPLTLDLTEGDYLAIYDHPDFERARMQILIGEGGDTHEVATLLPHGATPEGFVYVPVWSQDGDLRPYWIMEREVTTAEYFEFLDDPATMAIIDAASEPTLVPRSAGVFFAARGDDGHELTEDRWRLDWPVISISWEDAQAYAAWRTARSRAAGRPERYFIASRLESQLAWGCGNIHRKVFPWGYEFRAKWASSNYARPEPEPEPVMSFPIDESVFGVYDLAGSVSEWQADWYFEQRRQRMTLGGSWATASRQPQDIFGVFGSPRGVTDGGTNGAVGFRLIMRYDAHGHRRIESTAEPPERVPRQRLSDHPRSHDVGNRACGPA